MPTTSRVVRRVVESDSDSDDYETVTRRTTRVTYSNNRSPSPEVTKRTTRITYRRQSSSSVASSSPNSGVLLAGDEVRRVTVDKDVRNDYAAAVAAFADWTRVASHAPLQRRSSAQDAQLAS